jgi:transposase
MAVAAMRSPDIRAVGAEDHASVMRIWVRRHRDLSRTCNRIVCFLHAILCDLVAGAFPKQISAIQAAAVLDGIKTDDAAGDARLELAHELLEDLRRVDEQRRTAKRRLAKIVAASGTTVSHFNGAGPVVTATVIGDVGAISRFPTRGSLRRLQRHRHSARSKKASRRSPRCAHSNARSATPSTPA